LRTESCWSKLRRRDWKSVNPSRAPVSCKLSYLVINGWRNEGGCDCIIVYELGSISYRTMGFCVHVCLILEDNLPVSKALEGEVWAWDGKSQWPYHAIEKEFHLGRVFPQTFALLKFYWRFTCIVA
jgi:hypothetical protein